MICGVCNLRFVLQTGRDVMNKVEEYFILFGIKNTEELITLNMIILDGISPEDIRIAHVLTGIVIREMLMHI